jgi:hypothetical protein
LQTLPKKTPGATETWPLVERKQQDQKTADEKQQYWGGDEARDANE